MVRLIDPGPLTKGNGAQPSMKKMARESAVGGYRDGHGVKCGGMPCFHPKRSCSPCLGWRLGVPEASMARQAQRSAASSCHFEWSRSKTSSALPSERPYVMRGAPSGRLCGTHDESMRRGSRSKSMRHTCPAHSRIKRTMLFSFAKQRTNPVGSAFCPSCARPCLAGRGGARFVGCHGGEHYHGLPQAHQC